MAARFDVPESPRVAMVRQRGSAHPAWDDSPVLPTIIWIENGAGFSTPYLVNRPQLWFASETRAVPGERSRLFGTNLFDGANNPMDVEIVRQRRVMAQLGRIDESSHATPSPQHFPEPRSIYRVTGAAGDGWGMKTDVGVRCVFRRTKMWPSIDNSPPSMLRFTS